MYTKEQLALMRESLLDTCRHYNSTNTSMRVLSGVNAEGEEYYEPQCAYNGEGGRHCAFARKMTESGLGEVKEGTSCAACFPKHGFLEEMDNHTLATYGDLIQEKWHPLPVEFCLKEQYLHDGSENWTERGLSDNGVLMAIRIATMYELGITEEELKNTRNV